MVEGIRSETNRKSDEKEKAKPSRMYHLYIIISDIILKFLQREQTNFKISFSRLLLSLRAIFQNRDIGNSGLKDFNEKFLGVFIYWPRK